MVLKFLELFVHAILGNKPRYRQVLYLLTALHAQRAGQHDRQEHYYQQYEAISDIDGDSKWAVGQLAVGGYQAHYFGQKTKLPWLVDDSPEYEHWIFVAGALLALKRPNQALGLLSKAAESCVSA